MARKDHDETKLPKYAQQELHRLRTNVEYLRAKLAEGPENSDTFADPYADEPRPLGKGTTIRFLTGTERHRENFNVRLVDGEILEVSGGTSIRIQPHASNVIRIAIGDYF